MIDEKRLAQLINNPHLVNDPIGFDSEHKKHNFSNDAGVALYLLGMYDYSRPLYVSPAVLTELLPRCFHQVDAGKGNLLAFEQLKSKEVMSFGVHLGDGMMFGKNDVLSAYEIRTIDEHRESLNRASLNSMNGRALHRTYVPKKDMNFRVDAGLVVLPPLQAYTLEN